MCAVVGECCNVQSRSHETAAAQHNKSHSAQLFLYHSLISSQSKTTSWKSGGCHLQFYEDPRTWDGQIIKCGLFSSHPLQPPTTTFLFPGQNRYKRLQIILLLSCWSSSSIRAVINKQNCDSVAKVLLLVVFFSFFSYYGGGWDVYSCSLLPRCEAVRSSCLLLIPVLLLASFLCNKWLLYLTLY